MGISNGISSEPSMESIDEGFKEMWVPTAACAQSSGTLCCFGCAMQCYVRQARSVARALVVAAISIHI